MTDPSKLSVEEVRELRDVLEARKREPGDIGITWREASLAIKLCRHFLDNQPAAMTAGEFAGLVKSKISRRREDLQRAFLLMQDQNPANRILLNRKGVDEALEDLQSIAREHNIEIVEPKP